jgi:class 3 adenylate cyclase
MRTVKVTALSVGLFAVGLALFALLSARMLRPLRALTAAAGEVARGNLDVAVPAPRGRDEVGRLAHSFAGMLEGLRQRDFIRETFGRYISKEVVDTLLGSPDGLRLGGDRREITLLVSDLRGFTSLAGRLPPEDVIGILNRYFARVVEILTRYRATVDEFQGDGILAFFGAPLAAADDAERAVACAIEMQRALTAMNVEQRRLGLPELEMGIGINTGEVIVGNIGSEKRTKYGAVGAAINLAYRIEAQTIGGQVLLGPRTYELVRDVADVRGTLAMALKGVDTPITIHDVRAIRGAHAAALPERAEEARVPLEPAVPATCYRVDGKRVAETGLAASLRAVSATTAEAWIDGEVAVRDSLRLVVDGMDAYTKVLERDGAGVVVVALTDVSPGLKRWLDARLATR